MANVQKKISKVKVKKKQWFKITASKLFGNKEIGESYLSSADKAVGRKLTVNLKDLTNNVKDQKAYISFQINKAENNLLRTSAVGYELTPAYVKRVVRKNSNRIDECLKFKTKGGKSVVVKLLVITLFRMQRSKRSLLRKELHLLLEEEVGKMDFSSFLGRVVFNKVQSELKKKIHKICPVKEVAVRVLSLKEKGLVQEEAVVHYAEEQSEAESRTESVKKSKAETADDFSEKRVIE